VLVNKLGNPSSAHGRSSNLGCKILYHISRRRQGLLCEALNILYKLRFLVWVELILEVVFSVL
jgi:hypothetical protein